MAVTPDTPLEDIPTPEEISSLFEPFQFGAFGVSVRIVYAPLTRCRALNTIPVAATAQYYAERAHKGQMMLTEATEVSANGHGYPNTPGIYSEEQIQAWKPIVEAVKAKGAIFLCQIWHCGRSSHSAYNSDGSLPVAPSAVPISNGDKVFHPKTFEPLDFETPRALDKAEIATYVEAFRTAARNARNVGFDGIEVHAGNGYLIDQFLKDRTNRRTDEYGGTIANRARFLLEIVDACVTEIGAERVGVRLTPFGTFLDAWDSDPVALFTYCVRELSNRGVSFVDMIEPRVNGNDEREVGEHESLAPFRAAAKVPFVAAGGYTRVTAAQAIRSGAADLVIMGRTALANPDLLKRFKLGAPLNKYDRSTFYTPGMEGYIDYPFLQDTKDGVDYFSH